MFVFSKGIPNVCNYLMEECKCSGLKMGKNAFKNKGEGERITKNISVNEMKIKNNIWEYSVSQTKGHPATFPLQLAKDHIFSWSNEGDIVLDPFLGSGTTAIACKELNRRYIGFEISEEYFNLANTYLNKEQ